MFSLPFLAVIFFLILQIYASNFRFPMSSDFQKNMDFQRHASPQREDLFPARIFRPADFQRNEGYNYINPEKKLYHDTKPNLDLIYKLASNPAKRHYPGTESNLDTIYELNSNPAKRFYPGSKHNLDTIHKSALKCNTPECASQCEVMPPNIPNSGSIFANVSSVALYTNTLLEAIYSTDLYEVFDLSQTTAKQYVDFLTIYSTNYLLSLCIENADDLVEFGFRGVLPNFDVLTLPIVSRFYANSAANFLYTDGFLCMDNAEELALAYAQAMADCAKNSLTSDPSSKFQVLADGFVTYFYSLGLSTKEKVPFLAFYVGNEWFIAANNYKEVC